MVGSTISHYRILEKLGGGGMGVVYRAEDLRLKRTVALKFLPPELTRDVEARERFIHEAQAASALQHNNICTIHDIDQTGDGQVFIVMDLYEGETLRKRIERGALSIDEATDIALQVARGLSKAHEHGIVHRDIKPANIMLTTDGAAKIVDFGLAKLAGQAHLTRTGSTIGTAPYMSPEQARGEEVDRRSDIWSFGVVLYEMISARLPFTAEHETALMYQIVNTEPMPIESVCPACPPALAGIIRRTLTKDAQDRTQSISAIVEELKAFRGQDHPSAGVQPGSGSWKRLALRVGAPVLLLALVGTAVTYWLVRSKGDTAYLEQIHNLALAGKFDAVYQSLLNHHIPASDDKIGRIAREIAGRVTFTSNPPGAHISVRRVTPIDDFPSRDKLDLGATGTGQQVLVAGEYFVEYSAPARNSVQFLLTLLPEQDLSVARTLASEDDAAPTMVYVDTGALADGSRVDAFLIDKYEITNEEFLRFVLAGGYRNGAFWDPALVIKGGMVPWNSAVKLFVDRTGIPGPRSWSGGKYPEGTARHPVAGVSWYEANAYARWAGKELPTWNQWWRAAVGEAAAVFPWGSDVRSVQARANFGLTGAQDVGSYPLGVSPFGCFDMAGNVREWLMHPEAGGARRTVVGGSWKDPEYMFEPGHAEMFDPAFANDGIGFRCVRPITKELHD